MRSSDVESAYYLTDWFSQFRIRSQRDIFKLSLMPKRRTARAHGDEYTLHTHVTTACVNEAYTASERVTRRGQEMRLHASQPSLVSDVITDRRVASARVFTRPPLFPLYVRTRYAHDACIPHVYNIERDQRRSTNVLLCNTVIVIFERTTLNALARLHALERFAQNRHMRG